MLTQLLRRVGLVRASRYAVLADQARKLERRAESLLQDVKTSRSESHAWKAKAEELAKALRHSRHEVERQTERFKKFRMQVEQQKAKADQKSVQEQRRRAEHEEGQAAECQMLTERVLSTERDLVVARESLMAVEVKLDILEGAANVLDVRTRDVVARRHAETGTAV